MNKSFVLLKRHYHNRLAPSAGDDLDTLRKSAVYYLAEFAFSVLKLPDIVHHSPPSTDQSDQSAVIISYLCGYFKPFNPLFSIRRQRFMSSRGPCWVKSPYLGEIAASRWITEMNSDKDDKMHFKLQAVKVC